jgi:hypothetical protein
MINAMCPFLYLKYHYYAWKAIAEGYLSLPLSFLFLFCYYLSPFVLRLIDLTSIY